eukprot:738785-Prorocentrum_minimum.AAC.1
MSRMRRFPSDPTPPACSATMASGLASYSSRRCDRGFIATPPKGAHPATSRSGQEGVSRGSGGDLSIKSRR